MFLSLQQFSEHTFTSAWFVKRLSFDFKPRSRRDDFDNGVLQSDAISLWKCVPM